jgi:hypothetical protein
MQPYLWATSKLLTLAVANKRAFERALPILRGHIPPIEDRFLMRCITPSLDDAANAKVHRSLMRATLGKHLFEDAFKPAATVLSKFCSRHHATISHFSTHLQIESRGRQQVQLRELLPRNFN